MPSGMPKISYHGEAAEAWADFLDTIAEYNVGLTLTDGTRVEANMVGQGVQAVEDGGLYGLRYHEVNDDWVPVGEPKFLSCEELTEIEVY